MGLNSPYHSLFLKVPSTELKGIKALRKCYSQVPCIMCIFPEKYHLRPQSNTHPGAILGSSVPSKQRPKNNHIVCS